MIDVLDCINIHLVDDKTRVAIVNHAGVVLASGIWSDNQILGYHEEEVLEMQYDALYNKIRIRIRK